mmetsp:Transcript_59724/g.126484  ORF Transcript_59724/g.126484 Transcript_59724/m.126484 type:complete len:116 (+) Transcript_59724:119-466(+)
MILPPEPHICPSIHACILLLQQQRAHARQCRRRASSSSSEFKNREKGSEEIGGSHQQGSSRWSELGGCARDQKQWRCSLASFRDILSLCHLYFLSEQKSMQSTALDRNTSKSRQE